MKSATIPRRNPRQERSKITVNAILEAAARVWREQDYTRGSTNLIARRAGVSVGSLYQYFPNKTALLSALKEQCHGQLMARLTTACRAESASLEAALRTIVSAAAAHHRSYAKLERIFAFHLPETAEVKSARSQTFQTALRELLTVHQAELKVRDLELALFFLRSTARSIMHSAAKERETDLENGVIVQGLVSTALVFLTGRPGSAEGVGASTALMA